MADCRNPLPTSWTTGLGLGVGDGEPLSLKAERGLALIGIDGGLAHLPQQLEHLQLVSDALVHQLAVLEDLLELFDLSLHCLDTGLEIHLLLARLVHEDGRDLVEDGVSLVVPDGVVLDLLDLLRDPQQNRVKLHRSDSRELGPRPLLADLGAEFLLGVAVGVVRQGLAVLHLEVHGAARARAGPPGLLGLLRNSSAILGTWNKI